MSLPRRTAYIAAFQPTLPYETNMNTHRQRLYLHRNLATVNPESYCTGSSHYHTRCACSAKKHNSNKILHFYVGQTNKETDSRRTLYKAAILQPRPAGTTKYNHHKEPTAKPRASKCKNNMELYKLCWFSICPISNEPNPLINSIAVFWIWHPRSDSMTSAIKRVKDAKN